MTATLALTTLEFEDFRARIIDDLEQIFALADVASVADFPNIEEKVLYHYFSTIAHLAQQAKEKLQG